MSKRGKWVIPLSQIPDDIAIHYYLYQKTDIQEKIALFRNHKLPDFLALPLSVDFPLLEASVKEAIDLYGLHRFLYSSEMNDAQSYVSSSLTWNPQAIDKVSDNPHLATLGSSKLKFGSASQYEGKSTERNTYNDTFSFKEKTPFANHGAIKKLLDSFQRTLVRSRVSTILAGSEEATKMDFCWHNDELVFINLRVNIPIQTSPNYVIQIISGSQDESLNITEFELKKQFAYVYDTNKYHRPFCKKLDTVDRINMICGVSPWFDFDDESQSWVSNEFYGELHPFEMFKEGHISTLIKG